MKDPTFCNDYGDRPGCLGTPDERYTMRFDDLGQPPILWCAFCGPQAQEMQRAIDRAFATRPGFAEEFRQAINDASNERPKQ